MSARDGTNAVLFVSRKGTFDDKVWKDNEEAWRLLEKLRANRSTQSPCGENMYAISAVALSWAGAGFDSGRKILVGM